MLPTYPANLLPRPFANNGTFQVIPDAKASEGRASWQEGFPNETQLPLNQGGIAPARPDFNGIFNALSALAFWQQSGGQWVYNAALNYNTPAVVFHDGKLWFCKAANGPDTVTPGAVAPGTNEDYWIDFLVWLGSGGGGGAGFNPVGTIIMFHGTEAPAGYLACDGSAFSVTTYPLLSVLLGKATTPDMRGLFVRGYDPTAVNDPDGNGRTIATDQGDAIRNITGSLTIHNRNLAGASGVFFPSSPGTPALGGGSYSSGYFNANLDVSKSVPTAAENRPKNINLLYCIKHD